MSASSLWRRGARLLQPASGSSHFATGAKSVTARSRGSAGPAKERPSYLSAEPAKERPSYLSAGIERMKKAYEKYNESPPKPFKLKRNGDLDLLLTRRKGPEDIQVRCELFFHPRGGPPDELYPEELEGGDEVVEQKVVVNITMTITKSGGPQALELNVDCDRRGYVVNHIIHRESKDAKSDDDYFPAFWRIAPSLRSEFHSFLEKRGLDEIFACWVHDQMDDKAFRGRLRQLERINAFVESRECAADWQQQ